MASAHSSIQQKPTWHVLRLGRFSFKIDRRVLPTIIILVFVAIGALVFSISYGEYDISMGEVILTILGRHTGSENANHELVVWSFRMPRILVATMVGMALATSGAIMQGITRNPLADPSILGITSGASLAAVAVIVWYDVPLTTLPYAAFGGAVTMAALIYVLAWTGKSSSARLILVGIGLSAIASSLTTTMIVFGEIQQVQQAYFWLAGSVHGRGWHHVRLIAPWLAVFIPLAIFSARQLNTLNLGDEVAKGLGLNVELQRLWLLFLSVALAAMSVTVAGTVGFIGLVAPHITRRLVGPSHEGLILTSAILGGTLALVADLIGRAAIAPSELPLGIVTAMIGAPYFMFLLYQTRNQQGV